MFFNRDFERKSHKYQSPYSARLGMCVGLVRASQHMYGLARGLDLYVWSEGQDRQLPCVRACYHASSSCRAICPLTHTHAHHLAAIPPPSVGWIWGALPVRIERAQSMRCKCSLGLTPLTLRLRLLPLIALEYYSTNLEGCLNNSQTCKLSSSSFLTYVIFDFD